MSFSAPASPSGTRAVPEWRHPSDEAPVADVADVPERGLAAWIDRMEAWNNGLIQSEDAAAPNPRPLSEADWWQGVRSAHGKIRAEWDAYGASGGRLPHIEDLLVGPQGRAGGWWRASIIIARRRPSPVAAEWFPGTVAALLSVPGMLGAMWSVLGPGTELPPHEGDNAGSLRLLIGVDCPEGAGHEVQGREFDLADGDGLFFDDTASHSAWNRSRAPRTVIVADIERPLGWPGRWRNGTVQMLRHRLSPGYSGSVRRSSEWHRALNPHLAGGDDGPGATRRPSAVRHSRGGAPLGTADSAG